MSKRPLTPEETTQIVQMRDAAADGMHYTVLNIDVAATREEVEFAYREMVRAWHPDRFYSRDAGEYAADLQENFTALTRAWTILRDDSQRAAYDRELQLAGKMPAPRSVAISQVREETPSSFEVSVSRAGGSMKVSQPDASRPAPPPKPRAPAAIEKVRAQLAEQFAKARTYFEAARAESEAGNWAQAESAAYLATRYDPKTVEYQMLYKQLAAKARQSRAAHYVQLADQAESYAKQKEALDQLRKAVECDPEDGTAFYRLGRLLREYEDDPRAALEMYRKACLKNPRNVAWRLGLAELYETLGMKQNALREAKVVVEAEPKNEKAKALLKRVSS